MKLSKKPSNSLVGTGLTKATTFCRKLKYAMATLAAAAVLPLTPVAAEENTAITKAEALTFAYIADFSSQLTCSQLTYNDCRINASIYGSQPIPMQATYLLIQRINAAVRLHGLYPVVERLPEV